MKKLCIFFILVILMTSFFTACGSKQNGKIDTSAQNDITVEKDTGSQDEDSPSQDSVPEEKEAKKQIIIGWSPPDITGVFKTATNYLEKGAADAKEVGLDVQVITRAATEHTSMAEQVDAVNNLVQSKVDVLIVSPSEVEPLKPALEEAVEAGIPVIVVNLLSPIEGLDASSYIGFDNKEAAMVSAYSLLDALGGPGVLGEGEKVEVDHDQYLDLKWWQDLYKDVDTSSISGRVAVIEGVAGGFFSNERVKGYHEVVDQFPNIETAAKLPGDWNRQKAITAAENILQSNDELDAIYAACAEMEIGAHIAVKNADRLDEVIVIGQDGTPETLDNIRQGNITAETWHGFPDWGWYGAEFAVRLALGLDVPEKFDIRPRTEYKDNADNFYPDPKLEPIDWEAILEEAGM